MGELSNDIAYGRGISHGWDAANYANAYGGESAASDADRRARDEFSGERSQDYTLRSYYVSGYELGWQRFEDGQYSDGTPMDDTMADAISAGRCKGTESES